MLEQPRDRQRATQLVPLVYVRPPGTLNFPGGALVSQTGFSWEESIVLRQGGIFMSHLSLITQEKTTLAQGFRGTQPKNVPL